MFRRILCLAAVSTMILGLLPTPASAAATPAHGHYYLALGDSLAYGYQPTRATGQGYVDQLYAHLRADQPELELTNLGCPGETTATMRNGGICSYPGFASQLGAALAFLREHRGQVDLVTLTIGANDINACAHGGTIDTTCGVGALGTISANLTVILAQLRLVAPGTTFAAMTYYDPYLSLWSSNPQTAIESVAFTGVFNATLTGLYQLAGVRVADVAGAFATYDLTATVDGVPLGVADICRWTWMCAPAPLGPDIHANQQGYAAIAQAFEKVL